MSVYDTLLKRLSSWIDTTSTVLQNLLAAISNRIAELDTEINNASELNQTKKKLRQMLGEWNLKASSVCSIENLQHILKNRYNYHKNRGSEFGILDDIDLLCNSGANIIKEPPYIGWYLDINYPFWWGGEYKLSITDISFGSEYIHESGAGYSNSCFAIDETHFVVCYEDDGNNRYEACVATVDGTTISFGVRATFVSVTQLYGKSIKLDSTHFVLAWRDGNTGKAIIGTVSDNTITFGNLYTFNSASVYSISLSIIDSTHFIICFRDDTGGLTVGKCIIGTVSGGNIISFGSKYTFNSVVSYTSAISCAVLDSTHFVVCYREKTTEIGKARIGVITDSSIAYGTEVTFDNAAVNYVHCTKIDSTHFIIGYRDGGNSNYGTAIIGVVSGDAISFGSEYVFNEATTKHPFCIMIGGYGNVLIAFDDNDTDVRVIEGVITGDEIAFGSTYRFDTTDTDEICIAILSVSKIAICYGDHETTWNGTAIIGLVEGLSVDESPEDESPLDYSDACYGYLIDLGIVIQFAIDNDLLSETEIREIIRNSFIPIHLDVLLDIDVDSYNYLMLENELNVW